MKHKAERAITPAHTERHSDPTLEHAIYYALGVACVALCVILSVFVLGKALLPLELPEQAFWAILVAPLLGLGMGGVKLLRFTDEHRHYLYHLEELLSVDLDDDGEIGHPGGGPAGTFVMCPDGVRRRLDTELDPDEVQAVKRQLLLAGKATVRALTMVVGDRASGLREELIALDVCAKPEHDRAPALLTEVGRKAVMRW